MYRIGIDIGGTKIRVGLFHEKEKRLLADKKELIRNIRNLSGFVKETVETLCDENGIPFSAVTFCGVGIPGTVSEDGKKILKAPNISILSENLPEELASALNVPVRLIQDSRAAAWGEYLVCEKEPRTLVCITLGTGIGTGIVIDGKIYHGALGSAGELGHLPIREGNRACGCGKLGCLEKYCAGGGLDLTAIELLGDGKEAAELFEEAKIGNEAAKQAITDAVQMLGSALVSVVNLLSPDQILFSGGLSRQTEWYLDPLIAYIQAHCYSADGKLPALRGATLGEDSPLYGAALMPAETRSTPANQESGRVQLSASIMCADALRFGEALKEIEESGIEYIHADIMDNHFVPNLMLPPELLTRLRAATSLPFDYHIMTEKPETVIEKLDIRENDIVSVHYESTKHLHRVISLVKAKGGRAAVALNPATPVGMLEEIISELDMVLLMTVNPGFAGQKLVPSTIDKITRTKAFLSERGYDRVLIQVDGNCSFENAVKMCAAGADMLVVGSSSVFHKDLTIKEGVKKLHSLL